MINYEEHNKRSKEIWDAYNQGEPIRVPVTVYADSRNWLFEKEENTRAITMPEYLQSPDTMAYVQLRTREWVRLNMLTDDGVGYPKEEEGWPLIVDFQNFLEPAWFGGEVEYTSEPHCRPFLNDDNKEEIFEKGLPHPFSGINQRVIEYYEHFLRLKTNGFAYQKIPIGHISMPYNMTGTDGPFTICCGLRGAVGIIDDMLDHPDYAHSLMGFVTDAIIARIKAVRTYLGEPEVTDYCGIADDSIVLLSPDMYREFVLPYHKKIYNSLSNAHAYRSIHLCGDAQRFFATIQAELGVMDFDTGFPIDFNRLYDELSPQTKINGGVEVSLLLNGSHTDVYDRAVNILKSGVMEKSKRFVLREANSLSPGTPIKNVNMLYAADMDAGHYKL